MCQKSSLTNDILLATFCLSYIKHFRHVSIYISPNLKVYKNIVAPKKMKTIKK